MDLDDSSPPSLADLPAAASIPHAAPQLHSSLNPRSCITCRRRKVKCDKQQPCSNCTKQHIECIFPAPGRAPRRARKPPDNELLARLRKLEGVVKSLGASVDEPGTQSPAHDTAPSSSHRSPPARSDSHDSPSLDRRQGSLDSNFGRLVIEDGRSRYVNSSFWANLSTEVEDLKAILNNSDSDGDAPFPESFPTPDSQHHAGSPAQHGFMFGFSSHAQDLAHLHPSPDRLLKIWKVYEEHCDPLVKMLHMPSMRKIINSVKANPSACPRQTECLLFAVYFAAVTSLTNDECLAITGEDRRDVIAKYRFAVEQSLARANFLTSEEMSVLQAFVLFLVCLRRHEDARVIWSLSGLVVRMAMTLGLHRDGSHFGISPFDCEIRRRTWWQICILDVRTSEDHGSTPTIVEHTFDTKFPLNVNDDDLQPDMKEMPKERVGITEMTFCLIRITVTNTFRRLAYEPPPSDTCFDALSGVTLEDKERWIEECHNMLETKYLRYCKTEIPMEWVIATVSRLIMAKMWLIIYHPFQRKDGGTSLPPETRDRLFITSLESIEYALLLETEVRTVKWGWLFRTYCQWHALAFLLSELCVRTRGVTVQRAWRAVDATVVEWGGKITGGQKSYLWKPLRKLLAKARHARERELASDRLLNAMPLINLNADTQQQQQQQQQPPLPQDSSKDDPFFSPTSDTSFQPMPFTSQPPPQQQPPRPATTETAPFAFAQAPAQAAGPQSSLQLPSSNGSNTMEIANSPFFANHPPLDTSRWESTFPIDPANNPLAADWFTSMASDGVVFNEPMDLGSDGTLAPSMAAVTQPASGSLDPSPNPSQPPAQNPQGQQRPEIPWEDWDDMVRNFEMEQAGSTGFGFAGGSMGNGMQNGAGAPGGWRRPNMGETWL